MEEYQKRMVSELTDLKEKTEKLGTFIRENEIFNQLVKDEQDDMCGQYEAMVAYVNRLESRCNRFMNKEKKA